MAARNHRRRAAAYDERALLEHEASHRRPLGATLVALLAIVLALTVWGLPREHAPLSAVAKEALRVAIPRWHILEPVNEVVYGTRGFDTFGETFLLLAAIVGIGLVARAREERSEFLGEELAAAREQHAEVARQNAAEPERRARGAEAREQGNRRGPRTPDREELGSPWPEEAEAMTVVVRGGVRLLAPLLAVAGLYLVAWGYSPGGGFPGGAVILGVVLLAYVSVGYRRLERVVRPGLVEALEMMGAIFIVAIGVGGLVFRGSFSANFLPLSELGTIPSGGVLQAFSWSELIEVATGLILATFGLLGMAHDWAREEDDPSQEGPQRNGTRRAGRSST